MGAAGTEGNVREAMHGAWAVEDVCGMAQVVDTHQGVVSRNHVGPVEHGFDSTNLRRLLLVAVQGERARCLSDRRRCWALTVFAEGSCCSQRRPGVVALNTGKMVYETGSAKMYLAEQEVAEAGVVADIAHNQDSWLMNSGPPARGQRQVAEDIGRKPLQAYHTVHSS
jgi:hypothetical protein